MEIRKATEKDIAPIQELINANLDKLLPRETAELERLINCFYVIEQEQKIIGCACLEIYSPKIAEIRTVAVDKNFREQGVGKKLVEAALHDARQKNIYEIMVVTSNLKFFESLNFTSCLNEKYALFWKDPNSGGPTKDK